MSCQVQVIGFLAVCVFASVFVEGKPGGCPDLISLRDNEKDTSKPKIIYFEGPRNEVEIYCPVQDLGVVELVSDQGSLGVIEEKPHKLICRFGRWYGLDKYRKVVPVREVACLIHIANYLW